MNIERKPVAYGDLRGWIKALEAAGEIKEINAEVDWNIEIGTVMRLAQGTGDGPALMFNNIKDYGANARCHRIFGCGLASYRRVAMMLGVEPDTHPRDLVKLGRNVLSNGIAPKIVATGPVKENIVTGDAIDLYELPSPWWNRLDGGRYLLTYGGCVTKDHDTGGLKVGCYRGMGACSTEIPILMWRAQHVGQHATSWERAGHNEMPIAVAIGWEPSLGFTGGAPVQKGRVRIRRHGLDPRRPGRARRSARSRHRPARAGLGRNRHRGLSAARSGEIHHGGARRSPEFTTGTLAGDKSPKPTIRVTAITHRNDPILRGCIEGSLPGSFLGERHLLLDHARRDGVERAGARRACRASPTCGARRSMPASASSIQMKQSYRGQAKQAANAIWGSSAAHVPL